MGGEGEELKKIAATAYDYDNDPRWADYWSNILIPPSMASRSDVVNHFKQKFYQRYIPQSSPSTPTNMESSHIEHDPDLVVDPININSTQQSRPSEPPSQSSSASTQNNCSRPRDSGSRARMSGASTAPPPNSTSLCCNRQTIQFSVNAWVFVVAILSIFPLVPKYLSNRAYWISFMGTACSSMYSLYSTYGKPRAWNLQAMQVWFQSVVVTKDFIYSVYCLTFVSSHLCLKSALIPILGQAFEHVAKFLRRNFSRTTLYRKYLEQACVWVDSNTTTLGILSSQAEIGVGFLLIFSLLSWQRNIIQTFMYWQLLKLMYQAPATAGYHQSAWSKIGRTVNPFIQRYAPFLNSPISAVQRWWFR